MSAHANLPGRVLSRPVAIELTIIGAASFRGMTPLSSYIYALYYYFLAYLLEVQDGLFILPAKAHKERTSAHILVTTLRFKIIHGETWLGLTIRTVINQEIHHRPYLSRGRYRYSRVVW